MTGEEFAPDPISWSEIDLVQAIARRPNASAWYVVDEDALAQEIRGRTVADMVEAARAAGGEVLLANELGSTFPVRTATPCTSSRAITHTIGGLRVDAQARVLDGDGAPIEGLYAAGADAGGISAGGYASGLASALVLGRAAAETAADASLTLEVRAGSRVVRKRRRRDLDDGPVLAVDSTVSPTCGQLAVLLARAT